MSIYSGFATRNQENYYDHILFNLMSTLLVRIVKFYNREDADEGKFHKIIKKQQKILRQMEKRKVLKKQNRKYLQPKYANLLTQFLIIYDERQQQQSSIEPSVLRREVNEQPLNRTFSLLDKQIMQLKQGAEIDMNKFQFKDKQKKQEKKKPMKSNRRLSKLQQYTPRQMPKKLSKSKSKKHHSIKSGLDLWEARRQKIPQLPSLQPVEYAMLTRNNFNKNQNTKNDISVKQDRTVILDPIENQFSTGNRTVYKTKNQFRSNMFYK